jgi:hypothetical protein
MLRPLSFSLIGALAAISCGGSRPAATPPTDPHHDADAVKPATPAPVERVIVSLTRTSGTETTTVNPDGSLSIAYSVVWNGRGPATDATIRLAGDGTIASLTATGHHMMGTPVEETFTRDGDHATWKSLEEAGETDVTGAAFYLPMADVPDVDGLLVQAAIKNGGRLALLPSGELRVDKGPELAIAGAAGKRVVVAYTLTGLDLLPRHTWMNPDGTWFGTASEWWSVIPTGWDDTIPALVAAQNDLQRADDAALAQAQAHTPPAAGLAYTHARVLDVEHGKWLKDQTVVVVGGTIQAVGK